MLSKEDLDIFIISTAKGTCVKQRCLVAGEEERRLLEERHEEGQRGERQREGEGKSQFFIFVF